MKILLVAALALLLFVACRPKKAGISTVADWLEKHYPGRFTVVETYTEDPIKNLSFKKKRSVVAEKSNPAVQALLRWDKREATLGLSTDLVDSAFAEAARTSADRETLCQTLLEAGFERMSVGTYHGAAQVLLFDEYTAEHGRKTIERLRKALAAWPGAPRYGLYVAYLEPDAYRKEFPERVPLTHWERPDSWQSRMTVYYLANDPVVASDPKALAGEWLFNKGSERVSGYIDQARPVARAWAEKHLGASARLLSQTRFEVTSNDPLQFGFEFSYTTGEGEEPEGYVTGNFRVEKGTFVNLKKTVE